MTKKLSLLFLICILCALNINATVYEGSCGINVNYTLDTSTGLLSITGTGAMNNYSSSSAPWYSNKSYIKVVEISDGVTSIGEFAFQNCFGLTSVTIPNSVTSIGSSAFYWCSGLTSVTIPNSVTSIGFEAFYGCSGLTSVTIPNSVTSIGNYAFCYCSGLTSVTIPNSVTSIGYEAFYGCSGLTSVTIPNSVTSIEDYAFASCSGLTSVTIPNSVTSIGYYAFRYCSGLTSVTIPNSVTSIGSGAFDGCSGLTSVHITDIAAWCKIRFFDSYSNPLSYAGHLFMDGKEIIDLVIPNSVTSIGNYAFYGCSGLTSVKSEISVPFTFGSDAFSGISSNCILTVPYGTKDAYITKGWTTSVFKGGIKEMTYIVDGIYYDFNSNNKHATVASGEKKYSGNVIIPSSVTFDDTEYSVTSIGKGAFDGCSGLTSVTIPNSVTSIGSSAFYKCSGLTSITIPNSVTSIGNYAFSDCSGLTKVTLNSNAIASKSYSSSSTLRSIFGRQVKEFILGDDVSSIGSYAFYNCSNVTSVTIADNVTSVGDYAFDGTAWYNNSPDGLFYAGKIAYKYKGSMPENTSVIIKEGTVELNDGVFDGCTGLTSVYIPSSVKTIGNNAFAKCTELLDVYCYARKSPAMGTDAFANSGIQFATLYVPEASLNGYKVTEPWSGFGSIQALSGDYPEVPEITKCATPTIIFENGKLSFSCETEGARFVCNFSTPSESYEEGVAVNMPNKLQVSVYAKKDGYENSDVATKEIDLGTSGIRGDVNNDGVVSMPDAMFIVNKMLNGKFPDE